MSCVSPASGGRTRLLRVVGRAFGLLCALGFALVACGPSRAEPTPQPAVLPIESPAARPPDAIPPTIAAPGLELPGRLLFAAGGQIWLWQSESGHALPGAGAAFQPAWSPDGTRIAFVERTESSSDVLIMSESGGEPIRLTGDGAGDLHSYDRIYASVWAF